MQRLAYLTTLTVLGMTVMCSGEARADHDHDFRDERSSRFGAYSHVDELALRVMKRANSVCWEMYRHYRYEPTFRQSYRDAYEMLKTAEYIHELVHHHGRRSRVAHEIEELDNLFHQLEQNVSHWQRDHDHYYHGSYTAHGGLNERMEELEQDLHHLMDDAGYKPKNQRAPRPEAPLNSPPQPRGNQGYGPTGPNNAGPNNAGRNYPGPNYSGPNNSRNTNRTLPAPQAPQTSSRGYNTPQFFAAPTNIP